MTLEKMMKGIFSTARLIVLSGQEAMPCFFAQMPDGSVEAYMTLWRNPDEKAMMVHALKIIFAVKGVKRIVTVCEAWTAKVEPDDVDEKRQLKGLPISKRKDREERLVVWGLEHDKKLAAWAKIGKNGSKRTCGELEWMEGCNKMEGQMVELLPPADLPPAPEVVRQHIEEFVFNRFGVSLKGEKITLH